MKAQSRGHQIEAGPCSRIQILSVPGTIKPLNLCVHFGSMINPLCLQNCSMHTFIVLFGMNWCRHGTCTAGMLCHSSGDSPWIHGETLFKECLAAIGCPQIPCHHGMAVACWGTLKTGMYCDVGAVGGLCAFASDEQCDGISFAVHFCGCFTVFQIVGAVYMSKTTTSSINHAMVHLLCNRLSQIMYFNCRLRLFTIMRSLHHWNNHISAILPTWNNTDANLCSLRQYVDSMDA
jgi:hypothetical protein